jgi:YegS/Rv2252/BmrU family lipid kinase
MTALVINPTKVDDLDDLVRRVTEACARYGLTEPIVLETTPQDAGEGLARQAVADGAEIVLAAGGDGTVQSVCCGLQGTGVPLGILPLGTGNLLARNLEVPLDEAEALVVALSGRNRTLDLGLVRAGDAPQTCFAVMAGLGFDAQMMVDAPEQLKSAVGWPAYLVSGLKHLRDSPVLAEIVLDGGAPLRRKVRGVVVGNVGDLQAGVSLLPAASPDDGVLDVAVLAPAKLLDWGRLVGRLLFRSAREDLTLTRFTAQTIEVRLSVATQAQVDGEPLGPVRTLKVEISPGALVVRVPR